MDFFIMGAIYKLVVFLYITQATNGMVIIHKHSVAAVEGQNVTLPCIAEEPHEGHIVMLGWTKHQKGTDQKIAVFLPKHPIIYYQNNSALETRRSAEKLLGSVLNLFEVTANDNGNYICEMVTFPDGPNKVTTQLIVTGYSVSMKSDPHGFLKEGDDVKIMCSASPAPLGYELRRSKDELFLLESSDGEFVLSDVTRDNSDLYVCFPQWDSSAQHQQGFNTSERLTVNFVDSFKCNTSSPLKVTVGEDVAISCKANASRPLQYKWMKGDATISLSDTLSLSSVTLNQSGTYRLTAALHNNQLQTEIQFSIHVSASGEFTTLTTSQAFLNLTTQHLTNFTSVGTGTWNTSVTMTTSASPHLLTTSSPNATMTTAGPGNTSHDVAVTVSSSSPPVGSRSTLQTHFVNATSTSHTDKLSTTAGPDTRTKVVTSGTAVTKKNGSKKTTYIIIIPIVLLALLLFGLLYRRHLALKRMDMPPSFKPPPPPVKYTSVRNHDVLMTDILI